LYKKQWWYQNEYIQLHNMNQLTLFIHCAYTNYS